MLWEEDRKEETCRKPSVSEKIVALRGSGRGSLESGLLLTDVQVGHCITPQAMYLDFDGTTSPPKVVPCCGPGLTWLSGVCVSEVCFSSCMWHENEQKLPCPLEKYWLHRWVSSAWWGRNWGLQDHSLNWKSSGRQMQTSEECALLVQAEGGPF